MIGEGRFGKVNKGVYNYSPVAVQTMHIGSVKSFDREKEVAMVA